MQLWVAGFFSPYAPDCKDCLHRDGHDCQCLTGVEVPSHCPELRAYIRYEGVVVYGRAKDLLDRSARRDRR